MKSHILLISNLIIIFAIVLGFTISTYKDTQTYQQLAEKHLENVVSLADTDISDRINNSMSKPVMVSKTMANDEFLKTWLSKEPQSIGNDSYLKELYSYLKAYQLKYDYTTVFCISAKTGDYYYQDGLNKTISKNDPHDIWYYNFVSSGHEYDLEIDTNQANHNNITVFVNFRVVGDDGKLLGVIGVGLKASFIEDTIRSYEKNYNLSVYIINVGGAVNSFKGSTDIFVNNDKLAEYTGIKEKINMNKSGNSEIQWFNSGGERKCLITRYDGSLGWYLLLEMKTNSIYGSFQERIEDNIYFMLLALLASILVTTAVFMNFNRRIVTMENIDELTGLPNRKLFTAQYRKFVRKHRDQKKTLFMLDVDNFKAINDANGHMFGNAVLSMVAEKLQNTVSPCGVAARWGGDEFVGVLAAGLEESQQIIRKFMDDMKNVNADGYRVTVSVGITEVSEKTGIEQGIKKADELLYRSKENGRNCITVN